MDEPSMEFNNIAYFQFDNLLQSRVPMVLVLLDEVPLKDWYNSIVRMHIDNIAIKETPQTAVQAVKDKNLPSHFAVVVLDLDETKSPAVVRELEKLGLLNAYFVKGGFNGILAERTSPNR